jgi:beta-fructofuranosidase
VLLYDDRWVWDFWFADDGDDHHVFYLQAPKTIGNQQLRHDFATVGHAVSADLVTWRQLPDALGPGAAGSWDAMATWTGSIVRDAGTWSMFYTAPQRDERGLVQRIGRATSCDLVTWEKDTGNPLIVAGGPAYERLGDSSWPEEAWRDPWVFADPGGHGFHALITARSAEGEVRSRGVVGLASSADLATWTVREPITQPGEFGQLEVPQVEKVGDRWILVFSCGRSEIGPARRARLPDERGGSYWVEGPGPLGPFDVREARPFDAPGLYSVRLLRRRDGSWVALGFLTGEHGAFVGALSDPFEPPFAWAARPQAPSSRRHP